MSDEPKMPPLEAGLLTAMRALDTQVGRSMQRDPEGLSKHGVLKWEPYQQRVEIIASFLLELLGKRQVELDSVLILSQALTKTLSLIVSDLEEKGLGAVRSAYCRSALAAIKEEADRALSELSSSGPENLM